MGGAAGHLSHLHEDRSLTFNKLKKILAMASSGEIEGTEKTDGFNIYLGIKASQLGGNRGAWFPAWARNKGDMKIGGRSFAELAAREFAGGEEIKKTYLGAFQSFEAALKSMPQEELAAVFGENKEIFYNTEIQGPSAKNVINYDEDIISIHRLGHKFYDSKTNSLVLADTTLNSKYLDKAIDRFEEASASLPFAVRRTAFLELNKLEDDYALNIALAEIQRAGLSGNMTIEDFLENYLLDVSNRVLNFLSPDIQQDIVNRILKKEGFKRLDSIYRGFPPEVIDKIKEFVAIATASHLGDAIWPIELAIHNFAVELLKGLKSAYILDSEAELSNFKNEVESAIRTIQSYQGEHKNEVHDILAKQLLKLKHHDDITTVVEGFVFQVDDQMYKFTGNFAPINQLLGLFKFGRGKIPPMERKSTESTEISEKMEDFDEKSINLDEIGENSENLEKNHTFAVLPGGFKPPHAGHYALAEWYAELPDVDFVYVLIGQKSRPGHGIDSEIEITAAQSLEMWNIYRKSSKIIPKIATGITPVEDAYEFMRFLDRGDKIIFGKCEKDAADQRFEKTQEFSDKNNLGITVICKDAPEMGEGISGTKMRELVANDKREKFLSHLPPHLSDSEKDRVWDIVSPEKKTIGVEFSSVEPFTEVLYRMIDNILDEKYIKRDCKKESGESGHCAVISHKTNKQKACYDDCDTAKTVTHTNENEVDEGIFSGAVAGMRQVWDKAAAEGEWDQQMELFLDPAISALTHGARGRGNPAHIWRGINDRDKNLMVRLLIAFENEACKSTDRDSRAQCQHPDEGTIDAKKEDLNTYPISGPQWREVRIMMTKIYDHLKNHESIPIDMGKNVVYKRDTKKKKFEEVSTVASGAIEVSAGKKKKKSIIREDDEEIVEMVMNYLLSSRDLIYDNR